MAAILKGLQVNRGLVGYWPLGNKSTVAGNVAVDLSGRQANAALAGGPSLTPGPFLSALLFNGSTQSGSATLQSSISNQIFSHSAWVKFVTFLPNGSNLNVVVGDLTTGGWIAMLYNSPSTGYTSIFGSGFVTGTLLNAGVWHHICATRNGTGSYLLYLDGVLDITTSRPYSDIITGVSIANYSGNYYSNAVVSDVRLYNRVLSAAEIRALATNRNPNFGLLRPRRLGLRGPTASAFLPAWAVQSNRIFMGY